MSLAHAILGILQYRPMTGYDLKTQFFDQSIAHFWSADQAQIYRTLDKLAEQGFVESQIEYQEDRPNRKVYSITDAGQQELRHWLTTEQPLATVREPFLVQLFFARQLPTAQVIALLEQQLHAHAERLATYQAVPIRGLDDPQITEEEVFQRLTLELGLKIEAAYMAWVAQAIEAIQKAKR